MAEINAELAKLSYKPSTDYNGNDTLELTIVDDTKLEVTKNIAITVNAINDAPEGIKEISLDKIKEDVSDAENVGHNVEQLIKDKQAFDDSRDYVEGGSSANTFEAIVITNNEALDTQGTWQYKTADGTWTNIPKDVSLTNAFILDKSTSIRFKPVLDYNGIPGALSYVLAESKDGSVLQQTGNNYIDVSVRGNDTRYSADIEHITITVTPEHDAPEVTSKDVEVTEDIEFSFTGENTISIKDVDSDSLTVTLNVTHGKLTVGTEQNTEISFSGSVAQINEKLATLKYASDSDFNGADTLVLKVVDDTNNIVEKNVAIAVKAVNDAPVGISDVTLVDINEDITDVNNVGSNVADLVSSYFNDAKDEVANNLGTHADSFEAIVITKNDATDAEGNWQYQGTNGDWVDVPRDVSETNALVLDKDTVVRFNPSLNYNGTPGTLSYVFAESKEGSVLATGETVDVSTRDDASRYSVEVKTIGITVTSVDDAPTYEAPSAIAVDEDNTFSFTGDNAIVIADVDSSSLTVTIKVSHGNLASSDNAADTLTFTGSVAEINAELAKLRYEPKHRLQR